MDLRNVKTPQLSKKLAWLHAVTDQPWGVMSHPVDRVMGVLIKVVNAMEGYNVVTTGVIT